MLREGEYDPIGGIVIQVEPLYAAFFAGETFTARITFTNTHKPAAANVLSKHALSERPATATGVAFRHKRAAHSIAYGSAPLANPPTSPGTPNYSSQFSMSTPSLNGSFFNKSTPAISSAGPIPVRRGLVGSRNLQGTDAGLHPNAVARAQGRRALSVDMDAHGSAAIRSSPPIREEPRFTSPRIHPPSPLARSHLTTEPSSINPSSYIPMSRSTSMPIPRSHPHARKQSVLDGHLVPDPTPLANEPPSSRSSSTSIPSPLSASTSSPGPPSPSVTSTPFSSALDPISEGFPTPLADFDATMPDRSRNRSTSQPISSVGAFIHSPRPLKIGHPNTLLQQSQQNTPSGLGLGQPSTSRQAGHARSSSITTIRQPSIKLTPGRGTFSSSYSVPNTEVLLWSYAQLLGTVEVDESGGLVSPTEASALRARLSSLSGAGVVGGGRMDIGATLSSGGMSIGSRTRRGFISSFLSPPSSSPNSPSSAFGLGLNTLSSLWSSPSTSPLSSAPDSGRNQVGMNSPMLAVSGGLPSHALPTFETQPSMLAVDLNLGPGESRTYTYCVTIPSALPPTFRGKALRFSYHLVIGSSRASSFPVMPTPGPDSATKQWGHQSKIMRVPIRVYNHVSADSLSEPYDLIWPVVSRSRGPARPSVREDPPPALLKSTPFATKRPSPRGSLKNFEAYSRRLLALASNANENGSNPDAHEKSEIARDDSTGLRSLLFSPSLGELDEQLQSTPEGCRENVEIRTRIARKVSYDINKDGVKVAVLTFAKSAFRLGETVIGVVEFNLLPGRSRVVKFSATLEAQETVPARLANSAASSLTKLRGLRKVHAEHHCSIALDSQRMPFTLDIPSDGSPAFQVSLNSDQGSESCGGLEWKVRLCFLVGVATTQGLPEMRHLSRDGAVGEWGSSWRASASLAPQHRGPPIKPVETSSTWMLFSSRSEEQSLDKEWNDCALDTVECEIPISVWPGNTLYRPAELQFEV